MPAGKAPPQLPNEFRAECTRKYTSIESEQQRRQRVLSEAFYRLSDRHAAIDRIHGAGGEHRLVGSEKYDDRRNLLGLGEPSHRLACDERLARLGRIGK